MRDERWRQLLSTLPGEQEIGERAARARQRALARVDDRVTARRRVWLWAPAAALAVALIVAAVWVKRAWQVQTLAVTPPAPQITIPELPAPSPVRAAVRRRAPPRPVQQDRLQVHLVLSDGTRVEWTFDKKFNL